MTAIDWLRSKATAKPPRKLVSDDGTESWDVSELYFRGKLPYRMRQELQRAKLSKNDTEHEVLRFDHTPSGHATGVVEYWFTTYTPC